MATGFLKFDHDHTVYIDLDLATDEVRKAVIIDADDVETPICGGGSSDFTTAQVTIKNNSDISNTMICPIAIDTDNDSLAYGAISLTANETTIVTMILYKGKGIIGSIEGSSVISDATGDIVLDGGVATVTGDGSITVITGIN